MDNIILRLSEVPPGAVVAEDIFDDRGNFLLSKDSTLNPYIIQRLSERGVDSVTVYKEAKDVSHNGSRDADLSSDPFVAAYKALVEEMKEIMGDLASGNRPELPRFHKIAGQIISNIQSSYAVVECLNELRTAEDYTYTHSLNVAIYAMLMAKWLRLSRERLYDLVLAGLLHDIGKARIPEAIVKKHGKLEPEEYEFMKKHPTLGYNIVKDIPDIKDEIKEAILMHHERKDGTGYPQRVKGDEIGLYAKIISIADVYDAMTSERVYKKRITPFDTFREFESEGYQSFDTKIMLTFLSNIAAYYLGSRVRLDTGETGEIVYLPPQHISRPVIKVGKDRYVDMYRESDRRIVEML